jgi:hypothetical protein
MNTEKQLQLVTREQAERLRELGFNYPVYYWYNSDGSLSNSINPHNKNENGYSISAPTVPLALKWMRDEKDVAMQILFENDGKYYAAAIVDMADDIECSGRDTYDAAESVLLDKLIPLFENEEK